MSLPLIYAASLVTTFISWYAFTLIPHRITRGVLRATIIALLCSPGIIVGHGIGVAPTVIALSVQPTVFSYGAIVIIWLIALGVIFGVPALRKDTVTWPPSFEEMLLNFYPAKFFLFGILAAILMQSHAYGDQRQELWVVALRYVVFFAAALANLTLCYWAMRKKQATPFLTPLYFSAAAALTTSPNVAFLWYGAGAIGALFASEQKRMACWIALGVFGLLSANSLLRVYHAANAAPHVKIGGGVAGNAAMAALFAVLAIAPWFFLRRRAENGD